MRTGAGVFQLSKGSLRPVFLSRNQPLQELNLKAVDALRLGLEYGVIKVSSLIVVQEPLEAATNGEHDRTSKIRCAGVHTDVNTNVLLV